jgi:hypothetical protein
MSDPFAKVRDATLAHRAKHGCSAWPYDGKSWRSALVDEDGETAIKIKL